ncbi:Pre-mRNA-splicing factor SYF1 [Entamoeba marina]
MNQQESIKYFEEQVNLNPLSFKIWWDYIEYLQGSTNETLNAIYERSLQNLPGSYKLWYNYLGHLERICRGTSLTSLERQHLIEQYELCLIYMSKMPVIWKMYINYHISISNITQTRRIFDRSLNALPPSQHSPLWVLVMKYFVQFDIPLTLSSLVHRHLLLNNTLLEEYINIFHEKGKQYNSFVITLLIQLLQDRPQTPNNPQYFTHYKLLVQLLTETDTTSFHGIRCYPDSAGTLWVGLARYMLHQGYIDSAIIILEEALTSIISLMDFYEVYECYLTIAGSYAKSAESTRIRSDLIRKRIEYMENNQRLLVNSVLLRKNPNDIGEWISRAHLYVESNDVHKAVCSLIEGIKSVESGKEVNGIKADLWAHLIEWYLKGGFTKQADDLFEKALLDKFNNAEELASLWVKVIEARINRKDYKGARELCERATLKKSPVKKCTWNLAYGTIMTTRAVYEKMIDLKIISARIVLQYIEFLKEHDIDAIWRVFEKSVRIFEYPITGILYDMYLNMWIEQYGDIKLERTRNLFQQILETCPLENKAEFFNRYIEYEDNHSFSKHVIAIYKNAVHSIADKDKTEMYIKYALKMDEVLGGDSARDVFEEGITSVNRSDIWLICLKYAEYLISSDDTDMARQAYAKGCGRCSIKEHPEYWEAWESFENTYGDEVTQKRLCSSETKEDN